MTLRKIAPAPWLRTCRHPEHDPPRHVVLSPGVWEHTCPGCGHRTVFTVGGARW